MAAPATTPDAPYVLGVNDTELARLGLQHRLWAARAHQLWERARVAPGMTVLDLGCGPGFASADLAELVGPTGRVIAVDESGLYLKHLHDLGAARRLSNIDRVLGDVQNLGDILPMDRGVDIAYARWVLCFVPDVEAVVAGIARVLRPGARLAIQDYFNYESMTLAPRRPEFTRVIRAVAKSWRDRGGDPDVVARLPGLLRKHGLELVHLMTEPRVARPGSTIWTWPDSFWRSYVPRLVETGYISQDEADAFNACWAEASADPDCFMTLPPVFDVLAEKR
ncbi:MAG: methyltransferase domain-containing protein [Phycisphaerales bacterium]|nr:methyltransferase domain-containing protein [Phycisphaerales bacterium]